MSAFDYAILKKILGEISPAQKWPWEQNAWGWGCCDNSQCCEQLKKYGTDKYSVNTTANKYYSSAGHHEQKNKKVTGQFKF